MNPPDPRADPTHRWRLVLFAFLALLLMTLGEFRLRDRLLDSDRAQLDFVTFNVDAIRRGRPVFKAWQHRVLTPAVVFAIERLGQDSAQAIRLFSNFAITAANLLLFLLIRRKGGNLAESLVGVALFGFGHLLLLYKLEYPWDGVDLVLFLAFGYAASRRVPIVPLIPLLLLGTLNHETVLYIPMWYLLAPLDRALRSADLGKNVALGALGFLVIAGVIVILRESLYVGRPDLPGQAFEATTPILGNEIHAGHNLWQLLVEDWRHGRALINAGILSAVVLLVVLGAKGADLRASVWSGCVILTIFCFGYLAETRLYLPLLGFWFGYAWPPRIDDAANRESVTARAPHAPDP